MLTVHYRARLPALYSDFRPLLTLNPDGFVANVEAWKKGLAAAAKEGRIPGSRNDLLLLKVDEDLMRSLETEEWGRPLALGTVMRDAIEKKDMIPLPDYMAAKGSLYQRSWGISPWQIVSWGLQQIGLTGGYSGEDTVPPGKLVIVSNVEEASKEVIRQMASHTSRVDRIFSKQMFYRSFRDILGEKNHISHDDLEVLLKYLSRDKAQAAYDGRIVKFKGQSDLQPPVITPEDATTASLKNLIVDLETQVGTLTERVDKLSITAHSAVSRKNRVAAIAALRSKKIAESHLDKQSAVLGQLEEVFAKIGQAVDQVELVRVMEGSTGVLKALHKEMGGVERVDDVVDQLKEQMTQVNEAGDVIAETGQQAGAVDEDEVDDELEAMEREEEKTKEHAQRVAREKQEELEAAETRRRLAALEQPERDARPADSRKGSEATGAKGASIDENIEALQRLSL